jgi:hypothetical protein
MYIFRIFSFLENLRLTFRLYATLPAAIKALRSNAAAGNVGEGGVGMSEANDLAD